MHNIAMRVGNHLHFDMARLAKITLKINRIITKGGFGFGACSRKGFAKVISGFGHFHAASPATRSGLDQKWIANIRANTLRLGKGVNGTG